MSGLIPKLVNSYFEYLLGKLMTGFGLVGCQKKRVVVFDISGWLGVKKKRVVVFDISGMT
jgi:hypothetical protein